MKFRFEHDPEVGTRCTVGDPLAEWVGYGAAHLHPGDTFNRAIGRKVAAGRAIRNYIPRNGRRDHAGRAKRYEAWAELFKQCPKTPGAVNFL